LHDDNEPFAALFHCVIVSEVYRHATGKAKVLLLDLAYQYRGNNNGALVLCPHAPDKRTNLTALDRTGLCETSLYRGADELEARGLIVCTSRGDFSGRASRYGLTWVALNRCAFDYDFTVSFSRPLHWWREGVPDWASALIQSRSKSRARVITKINGAKREGDESSSVAC